ncbi:MAG TPA: alpha/beta fold hydrolase, partial [Microbacterium sp.]|nr:alpha/beta fold hydrolase [Microbacterium sp.]
TDRDRRVALRVLRAQLAAVHRWGEQPPTGISSFDRPVLILHGDSDRMVPVGNASALARVFPTAEVTVFPDAGHGVVFQNHLDVVVAVRAFLHR